MKLNPLVFDALARIAREAKSKVEFQFFPLAATGLAHIELARVVRARVPGATVFPEAPHDTYMERLSACELFLCPFPYGNMNSIVDSFRLGLPGICLDGAEAHAHADAAIFARIGLPPELAVNTVEDYVAATLRLIDDQDWRAHCRSIVEKADLDAIFFTGDARLFCQAIADLIWPPAEEGHH
jgi:predicted O-linked N-acetylglucosamine transferase (SPINDLY family)